MVAYYPSTNQKRNPRPYKKLVSGYTFIGIVEAMESDDTIFNYSPQ